MNFPRTSVVLAAGMGTRFLPVTKSIPKELLPVIDKPGIELIAEEVADAGSSRLVIVTSSEKHAVVNYFAQNEKLVQHLRNQGKEYLIDKICHAPNLLDVELVEQDQPLGIAHAVACMQSVLDPTEDAIAVLLPDDLVMPYGVLTKMYAVREKFGGSVLCAFVAQDEELSSYGVFDVEEVDQVETEDFPFTVAKVKAMVEKPSPGTAPSRYAAAGRYILDRAIFDAIDKINPGVGGEFQITDAVEYLIEHGHPVHIVVHDGVRHDIGNPAGYIRALVDFGLADDKIGPDLYRWLQERLSVSGRHNSVKTVTTTC